MKDAGYIVETKNGKIGRTYHSKGLVNNKIPVYIETEKHKYSDTAILCDESSLKIKGFIN